MRIFVSVILSCLISVLSSYFMLQFLLEKQVEPNKTIPIQAAEPVWKQTTSEESGKDMWTMEDLSALKEQMDEADKKTIYRLLSSELTAKNINQLSQYINNGLTKSEISKMKKQLEGQLAPEKMREIVEIFRKYRI